MLVVFAVADNVSNSPLVSQPLSTGGDLASHRYVTLRYVASTAKLLLPLLQADDAVDAVACSLHSDSR